MSDLDELLNGGDIAEPVVENVVAEAEPAETPAEPAPEPNEEAKGEPEPKAQEPKGPAGATPAPEQSAPEQTVPLKALADERRKRQDYERQLRELQQAQTKEKAPDLYEDPEGFQAHQERVLKQQVWQTRAELTEQMEKERVGEEKYDEAFAAFEQAAKENPALMQKMYAQGNPAKFVFDEGQRQIAIAEIQDPVAYREKVKSEVMAEMKTSITQEILAELKVAQAQPSDPPAKPPTSLADTKSTGSKAPPAWNGPDTLEDLLPS